MGEEVAADRYCRFAGQQRQGKGQHGEPSIAPATTGEPPGLKAERGKAKGRHHKGAPIRDPAHGRPTRIVEREERKGEQRQRRRGDLPKGEGCCGQTCSKPEQAVAMRQHRVLRPEQRIQRVGQRGERPQEVEPRLGVGPPGVDPLVHQPLCIGSIARGEAEEVERAAVQPRDGVADAQQCAVDVVVERVAHGEACAGQQQRDDRDGPEPARRRSHRIRRGGGDSLRICFPEAHALCSIGLHMHIQTTG